MTVEELIQELQQYPPETVIMKHISGHIARETPILLYPGYGTVTGQDSFRDSRDLQLHYPDDPAVLETNILVLEVSPF